MGIVQKAIKVLKSGGLVIIPSDTVYVVAADAGNPAAVKKLIAYKSRPPGKAISVFVGDRKSARKYVEITPDQENKLDAMLPGQYTMVFPSKKALSPDLESEKGTLGIRIPDNNFVNELVKLFGRPITATSANQAEKSPHYSIDSLLKATPKAKQKMIDLIIDHGKLPRNKPSTVVDFTEGDIRILRQGDVRMAQTTISSNDKATKLTARRLLKKNLQTIGSKPLVIMLYGELGAGKTVFVKGLGELLGIKDIVSPTFVIYYEYPMKHSAVRKLYHYDLYKLQDIEEFEHLGIEEALQPGNVIAIEWSEKSDHISAQLKKKATIITVEINHVDETRREIKIYE